MKKIKDTLIRIYLAARRRFLYYFRPAYVKKSLAQRKGRCRMCSCCQYTLIGLWRRGGGCKYLEKDKKCALYSTKKFPTFCKIYPIDEKDKVPFAKRNCGYYWD